MQRLKQLLEVSHPVETAETDENDEFNKHSFHLSLKKTQPCHMSPISYPKDIKNPGQRLYI